MLNRLPTQMPPLEMMLEDIGNPTPRAVAKALGYSERSVQRWLKRGSAPHAAMLAIFWLTRWGQSAVHCEAENAARMHSAMARCLKDEIDRLKAQLDRLGRIADFGAANDPAPGVPVAPQALPALDPVRPAPSVRTEKPSSTGAPEPGSTKQPRGFQRG